MRELYVGSCMIERESGERCSFDYYILIGEIDTGQFFCESYGIKIVRSDSTSICEIPNITTSAARIDGLVELVLTNKVTPISLRDVLEDWL